MITPTLGAQRARLDFNPSTNTVVDRIKRAGDVATAELVHIRAGTSTSAYVIHEPPSGPGNTSIRGSSRHVRAVVSRHTFIRLS